MKIKILNETDYRTPDLRRIIKEALRQRGTRFDSYTIEVGFGRRRRISGWAYVDRPYLRMRLPGPKWRMGALELEDYQVRMFAKVLIHEIDHTLGLEHWEMVPSSMIDVGWCEGLPLRVVEPVVKDKPQKPGRKPEKTLQQRRAEHAMKKLEEHERKFEREKRLVKKWRTKVRYYERALAKKAASRECAEDLGSVG